MTRHEHAQNALRRAERLAEMAELLARGERDPQAYSRLKREAATHRNRADRLARQIKEAENE
jgi:hypothetical protein